jgi:hypothetical protein
MRFFFGIALLLTGSFFLFYSGPDYSAARSVKEAWNLGHIGYFARRLSQPTTLFLDRIYLAR